MNCVVERINDSDESMVNRLRARGSGEGINRMLVVVEDTESIAKYGVREGTHDFPEITDYTELVYAAEDYLFGVKDLTREVQLTYYLKPSPISEELTYDGEIVYYEGRPITVLTVAELNELRRGDKVRVVVRSLGEVFFGVIEELDWTPESVSIRLGRPSYNLVDVIDGPRKRRERDDTAIGLPVPTNFFARPGKPGVTLTVGAFSTSRVAGVEVYGAATYVDFVRDRNTLLWKGPASKIELKDLSGTEPYFFVARSYDNFGNFSDYTTVASAVPGKLDPTDIPPKGIDGDQIDDETIVDDNVATDAFSPRVMRNGFLEFSDAGYFGNTANLDRFNSISVIRPDTQEVARLGYISDIPGVTGSTGFWGTLNSSVFLGGVMRLVAAGVVDCTTTKNIIASSFVVPTGFEWLVFGVPFDVELDGNAYSGALFQFEYGGNPAGNPYRIVAGSYATDLKISTPSATNRARSVYYFVIEMPSGFFGNL